jgi:hypothetical protein
MWEWLVKPPKLEERAAAAAKQMRYFQLFSQRGSFEEIGASARRAGFFVVQEGPFEASFQWAADRDRPDFKFHVSLDNQEEISTTAISYAVDLVGLVMTSHSSEASISIEKSSQLQEHQLGRYTYQFRSLMLEHRDFDDGIEKFVRRARLDPSVMTTNFEYSTVAART